MIKKCATLVIFTFSITCTYEQLNPPTMATQITPTEISVVDLVILNASILQCNVHCVANPMCDAFTLQRTGNLSLRSESTTCKLQRNSNETIDSEEDLSISKNGDTMLIMNRGPIYESNLVKLSTATTTVSPPPPPSVMPKYTNYYCSAMDELNNDNYVFFWSPQVTGATPMFTVVRKDNINGTKYQDLQVSSMFPGFSGSLIATVFTVNNITYMAYDDNKWMKFRINKTIDGLISGVDKLTGGITNSKLQSSVYSSTVIGNDSVLWRLVDGTVFCFHVSVIDLPDQITYPPPSDACQQLINYVKYNVTATSALGHDANSLRLLYNSKLYSYLGN